MNASRRIACVLFLAVLLLFGRTPSSDAQPKPLVPNPKAPVLKQPAPMGVQRGTTLDLTLIGTNMSDPVGLQTTLPAKVTIPTDGNNGKDPAKLVVRLEVPKDAPLGVY